MDTTAYAAATRAGRAARLPSGWGDRLRRLVLDVRLLAHDHAELAVLEAQRAGQTLVRTLAAAVAISVLAATAWLGIVAAFVVWMTDAGISWPVALLIGAVVMLAIGATTTFAELKDGLDEVLAIKAPATTSLWDTIRARVLSFGVFVSIGFLLLVSLAANAALAVLSDLLTRWLGWEAAVVGKLLNAAIAFVGTFLLFLGVYRFLPERRLARRALVIAAVASALLFAAGRVAIGLYLGNTDTLEAFGAAGSLAVVLIWVYYSSLAFYTGALIGRLAEEGVEARGEK